MNTSDKNPHHCEHPEKKKNRGTGTLEFLKIKPNQTMDRFKRLKLQEISTRG